MDEGQPTVTWKFPYILAPAKEWRSFGRLEAQVLLPEGWEAASEPSMGRKGDALLGSFEGVPADVLRLATRAPVPAEYHRAVNLAWPLFALAFVAGVAVCWLLALWAGRSLRWGTRPSTEAKLLDLKVLVISFCLAVLWWVIMGLVTDEAMGGPCAAVADQASPFFHERLALHGIAMFLLNGAGFFLVLALVGKTLSRNINCMRS
jgi:hypothetical protein